MSWTDRAWTRIVVVFLLLFVAFAVGTSVLSEPKPSAVPGSGTGAKAAGLVKEAVGLYKELQKTAQALALGVLAGVGWLFRHTARLTSEGQGSAFLLAIAAVLCVLSLYFGFAGTQWAFFALSRDQFPVTEPIIQEPLMFQYYSLLGAVVVAVVAAAVDTSWVEASDDRKN